MSSIRRYMTLILVSAMVLIIFSAAIHGYRAAMTMSSQLLDSELKSMVQAVTLYYLPDEEAHPESDLVYQVWNGDRLVSHSVNAPKEPIAYGDAAFSDQNFQSSRWRVYQQPLSNGMVVMVAQPLQNRITLTDSLTVSAIMPFIYSVPILAIIVFFFVSRGLSPLKTLSAKLSARKGKDLSPVHLSRVPEEMQPVVDTLNAMFSRLHDAFEREQQFASNAAHELRTPLSVMKINLHNLATEMPGEQGKLRAIQQDADRMIHVVNQILLLSRTSPELFYLQLSSVDVYRIAQRVITDLYSKIEAKKQDISLHGNDTFLMSTEFALYTLLQNLIANASAYSPNEATIQVTISSDAQGVVICVEDSGPGIAPEERENVLKRFYRDQQDEKYKSHGSGLGLAIVGQIVTLHQGSITLDTASLGGLSVTVTLPSEQGALC
ncbi:ATP-binding protein [Alteromonas sp. H39]|uniref:sensor histidine kinase n=1 Tax=Alteromonas sp. H39 TaxID=3389876 RepID=UPI0039E04E0B